MRKADIKVGEAYELGYGAVAVVVAHGWSESKSYGHRNGRFLHKGNSVMVVRRSWGGTSPLVALLPEVTAWARRAELLMNDVVEGSVMKFENQPEVPTGWQLDIVGLSAIKMTLEEADRGREAAADAERAKAAAEQQARKDREEQQQIIEDALKLLGIHGYEVRVTEDRGFPKRTAVKIDTDTLARLLRMTIDLSVVVGTVTPEEE